MIRLRSSVAVTRGEDSCTLRHGFWDFTLPNVWIASEPGVAGLLQDGSYSGNIAELSPKAQNVLALLEVTGCLRAEERGDYSYAEVGLIIEHMTIAWHGLYYSHPVWNRLRSGELGRNGFVAWVLHNYHLSRSAGATAARGVLRSPTGAIRRLFLESALEEYSHCEDYYCIDDARLGVSESDCRAYIPLPSSLALDQQMHRLAEFDWLGHAMVGFIQESTASYYKKCCEFYSLVESKYGLPGFFDGWKQHILLDLKYGHASAFKDAIVEMGNASISQDALLKSLNGAAIMVHFLIGALDEILQEDAFSSEVRLRRPVVQLDIDFDVNALLRRFSFVPKPEGNQKQQPGNGSDLMASKLLVPKERIPPLEEWTSEESSFLIHEIAMSTLTALSHSQSHEEIIGLGKVVECLKTTLRDSVESMQFYSQSPRAVAIANFLREEAPRPKTYCLVIRLLSELLSFESLGATRSLSSVITHEFSVHILGSQFEKELPSQVLIWARLCEFAKFSTNLAVPHNPFC